MVKLHVELIIRGIDVVFSPTLSQRSELVELQQLVCRQPSLPTCISEP